MYIQGIGLGVLDDNYNLTITNKNIPGIGDTYGYIYFYNGLNGSNGNNSNKQSIIYVGGGFSSYNICYTYNNIYINNSDGTKIYLLNPSTTLYWDDNEQIWFVNQ